MTAATAAGPAPEPAIIGTRWRLETTTLQMPLVAGLAAAAASGWTRAGEGSGPAFAVALGSVAPLPLVLAAIALRRRPWPALVSVVGHAGLLVALASVVGGGPSAAAGALAGGWARLLSTILPAPSGSEVEVLALVVAGGASSLGAELSVRCRGAMTPVVPAVVGLIGTRMVTQGVPESRLTGAAVAVVLLAGGLAFLRSGALRLPTGACIVMACALVAAAVAPALPWAEAREPFDPRALRDLDSVDAAAVNPLARLRAWQATPGRVLLRARLSERVTLRLAVLDRYDGVRFSAVPRFTPAGSVLPALPTTDPGAGGPTRPVSADIVVATLDGPWVPVPDRPTRVSGPPVAVDPATGVVVAPAGLKPGQRYRFAAAVPTERLDGLATAAPAGPEQIGEAATALPPGLPSELATLAAEVAGDPGDPPAIRVGRLQELFRSGFSEDRSSPPGHSLARLSAFLDPDDRVGSTEQLATAFAVLARTLGYPTRVVVGFRPSGPGEVAVRGADARAWPEVALAGAGWVAFDPIPPEGGTAASERTPEAEAVPAAPPATTPSTSPPLPPVPSPLPAPPVRDRSWSPVALAGAGAAVLAAVALAGIVGWKRWRRSSRRRAADPVARVRGAWAEAADRMVERGLERPPHRTPRDAVGAVGALSRGAAGPMADLGELAERAAFAGPAAVVGADADRAWADLALIESALAAQAGRLTRLRCAVDLRPLALPSSHR